MADNQRRPIVVALGLRKGVCLPSKLTKDFVSRVKMFVEAMYSEADNEPLIKMVWANKSLREGHGIDVCISLQTHSISDVAQGSATWSWVRMFDSWVSMLTYFSSIGVGVILRDNSGEIIAQFRRYDVKLLPKDGHLEL